MTQYSINDETVPSPAPNVESVTPQGDHQEEVLGGQEPQTVTEPESSSEQPCEQQTESPVQRPSSRAPLALTRLRGYNNPGLQEQTDLPRSRRRPQSEM